MSHLAKPQYIRFAVQLSANEMLTPEEEKEFREIFNLVDRDKGGTISKEELTQLMNTLQISSSQVSTLLLLMCEWMFGVEFVAMRR